MAACRSLVFFIMCMIVSFSIGEHKHGRGLETKGAPSGSRRAIRDDGQTVCPPPLGVIRIQSHSENIAGLSNQGGLSNLLYMCGTTQVPYQAPSRWVMREGPDGSLVNVTIYEKRYKMVPLCCPGYVRNDMDVCVPNCKGNCSNGLCVSPNNCVCYDGYALNDLGECVVTCPCGCPNGQCYGNRCVCNPGYNLDSNGVCNPICINECVNGDCSSPNECSCHFGYKKKKNQDSHVCFPHCTVPCENGICVEPDVCKCSNGYTREKNTGRCVPKCNSCENGDCVAPYTCHCHKGYKRENEACAPVCVGGCYNATCSAPNSCRCFDGYKHASPNICIPKCSPACQNAECVAPNNCKCYPGFMKQSLLHQYKCVSIAGSIVNAITHR